MIVDHDTKVLQRPAIRVERLECKRPDLINLSWPQQPSARQLRDARYREVEAKLVYRQSQEVVRSIVKMPYQLSQLAQSVEPISSNRRPALSERKLEIGRSEQESELSKATRYYDSLKVLQRSSSVEKAAPRKYAKFQNSNFQLGSGFNAFAHNPSVKILPGRILLHRDMSAT